jgi:hypothetical protein
LEGDEKLQNSGTLGDSESGEFDLEKIGVISDEFNGIGQTFNGDSDSYLKAPGTIIQTSGKPKGIILFISAYFDQINSENNYLLQSDEVTQKL